MQMLLNAPGATVVARALLADALRKMAAWHTLESILSTDLSRIYVCMLLWPTTLFQQLL